MRNPSTNSNLRVIRRTCSKVIETLCIFSSLINKHTHTASSLYICIECVCVLLASKRFVQNKDKGHNGEQEDNEGWLALSEKYYLTSRDIKDILKKQAHPSIFNYASENNRLDACLMHLKQCKLIENPPGIRENKWKSQWWRSTKHGREAR